MTSEHSDLIARLREKAAGKRNSVGDYWGDHICNEAADAIQALTSKPAGVGDIRGLATSIVKNLEQFATGPHKASWCGLLDDSLLFADQIAKSLPGNAAPTKPDSGDTNRYKAAYVRMHGSDEGWLGFQGSYFISGLQAADAVSAGDGEAVATTLADYSAGQFGDIEVHRNLPWGTKLYTAQPAPAAKEDR